MNYNYTQPQYQQSIQAANFSGYRPVPQYSQWNQAPNLPAQVRPVSSIEEVRACPIDFDGSVFYFADVANRRIYTKQINLDGTVSINLYEQKEIVPTDQPANYSSYVTKDEFEKALNNIRVAYEKLVNTVTPIEAQAPVQENPQPPAAQPSTPLFSF